MAFPASTLRIVPRRPAPTTSACLVKVYPAEPTMGARHAIGHATLLAGRDEASDIRIDDQSVSRRHARVQPALDGCYVIDLGSTNGTFVNDQRVTKARLCNGDSLRIGSCLFRYLDSNDIEAAYHEEVQRLASRDPLTEAYNRRFLVEALERELSRGASGSQPALLLIDVDDFPAIVERFSQAGGEYTLRELATCLRGAVRVHDVLARIGGEEFALLLPAITPEEAAARAEQLRQRVKDHPFVYQGTTFSLSIRVGVATPAAGERLQAGNLMQRADRGLTHFKRDDRNSVAG